MDSSTSQLPKRTFPPLYKSSGDVVLDRLAFFHVIERLKTQKRTGWVEHGVPKQESIADHMYRMAMLAMCATDTSLDISKSVCHDVLGSRPSRLKLGTLLPREGIPKAEKRRLEEEAMHNFTHEMLHDSPVAERINLLWKEYEEGKTPEARFVKDLDRFEMASQAFEYEKNHGMRNLQEFFDCSLPLLKHPDVQKWGEGLSIERKRFHEGEENTP